MHACQSSTPLLGVPCPPPHPPHLPATHTHTHVQLFQLVAAICRDDTIATAAGSFMLLIFINLTGFVLNYADIPPWWLEGGWGGRGYPHAASCTTPTSHRAHPAPPRRPAPPPSPPHTHCARAGYWPNPFAWVTRALAINEFTAPQWMREDPINGGLLGINVLSFRRARGGGVQATWAARPRAAPRGPAHPPSPAPHTHTPPPRLPPHPLLHCPPPRGLPSDYWWVWASVGFIIVTMIINVGALVAACSLLGRERPLLCAGREGSGEGGLAS